MTNHFTRHAAGLVGALTLMASLLTASSAAARVGQHENRFLGNPLLVYGHWSQQPSVTVRGRRVLVLTHADAPRSDVRATVGSNGYVTAAVLRIPRAAVAVGCELTSHVTDFLIYVVPVDDEDETQALVYDDVRRRCGNPPAPPVTQLGQVLAGTRTSGRMRLTGSEIVARTTGRGSAAMLELTVTFRGALVPDMAAAALPPRPTSRTDGVPMMTQPTGAELAEAGSRMVPELSACIAAGAAPGEGLVALELDWTGHVSNVTLPAPWITSRGAGCLETALRKLTVQPFLEPTYTVRYPITLR